MDFKKVKERKQNEITNKQYRNRAEKEKKRLEDATDTEFWFAVCFYNKKDKACFCETVGLTKGICSGIELRKYTAKYKPANEKKQFVKQIQKGAIGKNKLEEMVEYCGDLECDSLAELIALRHLLNNVKKQKTYKDATDSHYYFIVYFRDREDKEQYLKEYNLLHLGDKYINGSVWLKEIKEQQ